jgi:hypothetical protein
MGLWYRVFGGLEDPVQPAAILAHLNAVAPVTGRFDEEGEGWLSAEIDFGEAPPLRLERFPTSEEGIRAELNSWAGYLETCDDSPNHVPLMERVIQTKQLFTLRRPNETPDGTAVERRCVGLCQFLARATDGVYQADDLGFFASDGTLLLREH